MVILGGDDYAAVILYSYFATINCKSVAVLFTEYENPVLWTNFASVYYATGISGIAGFVVAPLFFFIKFKRDSVSYYCIQ